MLGKIAIENRRTRIRLRVRKFRKCKIEYIDSKFDIPKDFDAAKYWKRWADMKRDINASCARFWEKRKTDNAHAY